MNSDKLQSEAISLVCFFVVSARELFNDPKYYGPMRLMEATQRLVEMVESSGVRSELLAKVSQRIEAMPLEALPEGEEEFVSSLDELIVALASWVSEH
ncbi:DUF6092 family protein [Chloroflexota bacterium]